MDRRSDTITHVAIELREDRYAVEWPALALITGCWEPGLWKHRAVWCIEAAVHFRMPTWRVVHGDRGDMVEIGDGWRESPHVEHWEHWVYAKSREAALSCLVRDLRADPRHEFISHAAVFRITPPLTVGQVQRIEAINSRLLRNRAAEFERLFGARATGHESQQRQLAFAGMS